MSRNQTWHPKFTTLIVYQPFVQDFVIFKLIN